jgi:hypothetical protein
MKSARAAIEALGIAGIAHERVSLEGAALAQPDSLETTRQMDQQEMKLWLWTGAQYSVLGAILGAIASVPITLLVIGLTGIDFSVPALLAGMFLGGFAGLWAGYAIGHSTPHQLHDSEAWVRTFDEDAPGPVVVRVHVDDSTERTARETLERHRPSQISDFDDRGTRRKER